MDVQQLFRSLRKEAECPLCLETVNEPKTLPCLHSFCLLCLDKHAAYARRQLQTTIKCPVCLTCFQIPEGDTFGRLPTSFHLNRLVDLLALRDGSAEAQRCSSCEENNAATCYCFVCQNFLCVACFEAHQRLKATRGHRNIIVENLQAKDVEELIRRPVMCSQQYHEDQALEYYCEECKVSICLKCIVVNHNRHPMVEMAKAADEQKMQITDALEKVKAEVVSYENQMKEETELMDKSKLEISAAQKKMTQIVDDCIRILTEHKLAMNTKFNEINQAQLKAHTAHLEIFQFAVTQLKSSVEQGERVLQRNINAEILQTKEVIIGRCEELLNAKKPEIYKPPRVNYVVENKSELFDRVVVSNTDPLLSLVKEQCWKEIEEKTETSFTIVTRDSDGILSYQEEDHIKVNIQTPSAERLKTEIKDKKDGNYTVAYTPECVGQYKVAIEINGQPLTGSPWSVQVVPHQYKFLFKFGSSDNGPGQLNYPFEIAVSDQTGTIAVTDNEGIQWFSSDGNYLRETKLYNCQSIAFTKSGEILVLVRENYEAADQGDHHDDDYGDGDEVDDEDNDEDHDDDVDVKEEEDDDDDAIDVDANGDNDGEDDDYDDDYNYDEIGYMCRISLFTESGQLMKHIRNEHDKKLMDISVVGDDRIVACDWENNEVRVISSDGTQLLQSFGAPDCDEYPWGAIYHQDKFFVSYNAAHHIKVFSKEGIFLYNIGSEGSGDGQLINPTGLTVDKFNNLIVCDKGNERLEVFTLDGKFLTKVEQPFFEESDLCYVAMAKHGQVLVVDGHKNCVYVFQ